jgi:Zn-finger nucleic acid-binding protein
MIIVEYEGVEIDCCVICGGNWLDAGELTWLAELSGARPGKIREAIGQTSPGPPVGRRCPRCNKRLRRITVAADVPVELDRCPRGHGLWFDAGEVATVITAFHDGEEGAVGRLLAELHHSELESNRKGE